MARSTKEKITGAALRACQKAVDVFSTAIGAADDTSTLLETAVTKTITAFKGRDLEAAEVEYVADGIAKERDWNPDTTKSRKSQIRKVLRALNVMPKAIAAFRKASPYQACGWHQSVSLAAGFLALDESETQALRISTAVADILDKPTKPKPEKLAATKAKVEVAKLVKRMARFKKLPAEFHGAIADVCEKYGIE